MAVGGAAGRRRHRRGPADTGKESQEALELWGQPAAAAVGRRLVGRRPPGLRRWRCGRGRRCWDSRRRRTADWDLPGEVEK